VFLLAVLLTLSLVFVSQPIVSVSGQIDPEEYIVAELDGHAISNVTAAGRTPLVQFPQNEPFPGCIYQDQPNAVALDSDGNFIVSIYIETVSTPDHCPIPLGKLSRITRLTHHETILYWFGETEGGEVNGNASRSIAIDSSGNYIVLDGMFLVEVRPDSVDNSHTRIIYNFTGTGLSEPYAVAVDSAGNYITTHWYVMPGVSGLARIAHDGSSLVVISPFGEWVGPSGIVVDPSGDYIVTELSGALSRITPDGLRYPIYTFYGGVEPHGLAIDSSGDYIVAEPRLTYVSEIDNGYISRITPGGERFQLYMFPADVVPAQGRPVGVAIASTTSAIVFTAYPSYVGAGSWTTAYTVQRRDQYGKPVTSGVTEVNLESDSTGSQKKFSESAGGSPVTSVSITEGSSTVDFYYYDEEPGTWTITASAVGLESDSRPLVVFPRPTTTTHSATVVVTAWYPVTTTVTRTETGGIATSSLTSSTTASWASTTTVVTVTTSTETRGTTSILTVVSSSPTTQTITKASSSISKEMVTAETRTVMPLPLPGFPLEAIIAGLLLGSAIPILRHSRSRRR
jgi:hypothetical protein